MSAMNLSYELAGSAPDQPGFRVVIDHRNVREADWRREWDEWWNHALAAGWCIDLGRCRVTELPAEGWARTPEHGGAIVLDPDADCTRTMGATKRNTITVDCRRIIETLAHVGGMRGWWTCEDRRTLVWGPAETLNDPTQHIEA